MKQLTRLTRHGWQVCCSWHAWQDTTDAAAFSRHGTVYIALRTTRFTRHENMIGTTNTVFDDRICFLTRARYFDTIPSLIYTYIYMYIFIYIYIYILGAATICSGAIPFLTSMLGVATSSDTNPGTASTPMFPASTTGAAAPGFTSSPNLHLLSNLQ